MLKQIVMRCGFLVLLVVSACFSPQFEDGKVACGADGSCPPGLSCFDGLCRSADPGPIDAPSDAPGDDANDDAPTDAPIDAPPEDVTLTVTYGGNGKGTVAATGLTCDDTGCTGTFAPSTTIILTQAPTTGSDFTTWGGACSGSDAQCSLTLTADTTVSAEWTLQKHRLTVAMNGNGVGTVSSPAGISCMQNGAATSGTCTISVDHGSLVTLTQGNAGSGSSFLGWSGGNCTGTGATCSITVDADTTVNAPFGLNNTLVISGGGNGLGTVASTNDASINCTINDGMTSGTCSHTYGAATNVMLLATADAHSDFAGWTGGGCSAMVNPCTVSVNAAVGVTATFTLKKYSLTVNKANNGADTGIGTVTGGGISCGSTCSVMVDYGTAVSLTQVPNTGSQFEGWAALPTTANCMGTGGCMVVVNQNTTVTASYRLQKQTLSVATDPADGSRGRITSNVGGINCPGTCSAMFNFGAMVTLTAAPVTGYKLISWDTGPCAGSTSLTCNVTIGTAAIQATARFGPAPFDLTVQTTGLGTGTVTAVGGLNCMTGSTANCTKTYTFGDSIQLMATPAANTDFLGFTFPGGNCGTSTTCLVPINGNVTVQANFAVKQLSIQLDKVANAGATGTVTSTVGGINCGAACASQTSSPITYGNEVTLTATGTSPNYAFDVWGGACASAGSAPTCTLTMTTDVTVTARFKVATYSLRVDKIGDGQGFVSSAAGINCGTDCDQLIPYGSSVTLSAVGATSPVSQASDFLGWSGTGVNCPGTGSCTVTVLGNTVVTPTFKLKPNYAFVTSTTYTGNLGGHAGADAICQQRASGAGVPGTYVAWISTTTSDATTRIGTASGWVRTDGKPFALTKADLLAGKQIYPLRYNEFTNDAGDVNVWTSTTVQGTMNGSTSNNCNNWSLPDPSLVAGIGKSAGYNNVWTQIGGVACSGSARLYCLGIDRAATVDPLPAPSTQFRRAFVSSLPFNPSAGIGGADEICAKDADQAGLSGTFLAFMASDTESPASRFSTSGGPWIRPDNATVSSGSTLFSATLWESAINVTANGQSYLGNFGVWVGAQTPTTVGTSSTTCTNWTTTAGSGRVGRVGTSSVGEAFNIGFGACTTTTAYRVYCLEK